MLQQTVTLPQSTYNDLIKRIEVLENIVLKKNGLYEAMHIYETEKKQKKLKKLSSVSELFS